MALGWVQVRHHVQVPGPPRSFILSFCFLTLTCSRLSLKTALLRFQSPLATLQPPLGDLQPPRALPVTKTTVDLSLPAPWRTYASTGKWLRLWVI